MPSVVKAKSYKVKEGDSIDSIAKANGMTWQELSRFNWDTDVPDEINKFLRDVVGCRTKTKDGKNYQFTDKDDPGILYIPEETSLAFDSNNTHNVVVVPPAIKAYIPAECEVSFRPSAKWNGEYGFDWMRVGDFPIIIEGNSINATLKFEDVIGYQKIKGKDGKLKIEPDGNKFNSPFYKDAALYDKLKNEYKEEIVPYFKGDKGVPVKNFASYLSIYVNDAEFPCPQEIALQAFVNVKLPPEKLSFKFDDTLVKLSLEELPKATGKSELKVTVLKELEKDCTVEVISTFRNEKGITQEVVAGRLILVANSKKHRKKVKTLLVSVTTPAVTKDGERTGDAASNVPFINTMLRQALIEPVISKIDLDFTDAKLVKDFTDNFVSGTNIADKGKVNKTYLSEYCLATLLKDEKDKTKYKDYLVAFYFAENNSTLNGYSLGHNVVLYAGALKSTSVHEWLHSLGLPHTFTGTGTFTYKYSTTENIMDYTHHRHIDAATKYFDNARISLYHWQWKIANAHPLTQAE